MFTRALRPAAVLLAAVAVAVAVAAADAAAPSHPDMSGVWRPRPMGKIEPAELTPAFRQAMRKPDYVLPGRPLDYARRWCLRLGMPALMAEPFTLAQIGAQTALAFEIPSDPRHIYTDGRPRPGEDVYDPQINGFSLGHWEGDVLVVETAGFADLGVRDIPGGGLRGPDSKLVERFSLSPDGKTLTVASTWTDPKVFAKPHSYSQVYDKAPEGTIVQEEYCDAIDPSRAVPKYLDHY